MRCRCRRRCRRRRRSSSRQRSLLPPGPAAHWRAGSHHELGCFARGLELGVRGHFFWVSLFLFFLLSALFFDLERKKKRFRSRETTVLSKQKKKVEARCAALLLLLLFLLSATIFFNFLSFPFFFSLPPLFRFRKEDMSSAAVASRASVRPSVRVSNERGEKFPFVFPSLFVFSWQAVSIDLAKRRFDQFGFSFQIKNFPRVPSSCAFFHQFQSST